MAVLRLVIEGNSFKELRDRVIKELGSLRFGDEKPYVDPTNFREPTLAEAKGEDEPDVSYLLKPTIGTLVPAKIPAQEIGEAEEVSFDPSSPSDSRGIPWDERIHSDTKTKTSGGVWRRKRGVEDADFDRIEAQLKLAVTTKQSEPVVPVVPVVEQPVVAPTAPVAPVVAIPLATATTQVIPTPTGTQPVMFAHTFQSFKDNFLMVIASLINEKKITQDYVNTLKAHFGVKELYEMFNDDTKLSQMFQSFVDWKLITEVK